MSEFQVGAHYKIKEGTTAYLTAALQVGEIGWDTDTTSFKYKTRAGVLKSIGGVSNAILKDGSVDWEANQSLGGYGLSGANFLSATTISADNIYNSLLESSNYVSAASLSSDNAYIRNLVSATDVSSTNISSNILSAGFIEIEDNIVFNVGTSGFGIVDDNGYGSFVVGTGAVAALVKSVNGISLNFNVDDSAHSEYFAIQVGSASTNVFLINRQGYAGFGVTPGTTHKVEINGSQRISDDLFIGDDLTVSGDVDVSGSVDIVNSIKYKGAYVNVISATSDYNLSTNDDVVLCDGTFNVNLPSPASYYRKVFTIKNIDTGIVSVIPNASELIDGTVSAGLNQYESISLTTYGTDWYII